MRLLALNAIDVRGRLEPTAAGAEAAGLRLVVLAVAWATAHIHGQVLSRMLLRLLLRPRVSEQREVVATEDSLIWKESNGNGYRIEYHYQTTPQSKYPVLQ